MEATGKLRTTGEKMTFLLRIRRGALAYLERGILEQFGILK